MFENEINEIMLKYKNSCELLKRLHKIYNDYDFRGSKRDDIFYLNINIESINGPEHRACNILCTMLKNRGLQAPYKQGEWTIKELLKIVKDISIDDFYLKLAADVLRYTKYELNKMEYKEAHVYSERLNLILDCIYLLENPEPTPKDILCKISKYTNKGEPFIFRGCKVVLYKNGNLKIKFSSAELFEHFKNNFEKALKKVTALKQKEA